MRYDIRFMENDKMEKSKKEFPNLNEALEEITRLRGPIQGNSFWVKTSSTKGEPEVTLFHDKEEAVMSFESMEEAITQDVTVAEFQYNPDADLTKQEANWTINPISWREIAKTRLDIQRKREG